MNLPRLAYIADVPVESSYHGSALVYRLLQDYPPASLRIVETTMHDSQPGRRLPAVEYAKLDVGARRLMHTRWHSVASSWYSLRGPSRAARIPRALGAFAPSGVLTVAHGYGWLSAARYARAQGLPLHMIIHDDWPRQAPLAQAVRQWVDARFGEIYRQCVSRFCVSRYMLERYRERYGVDGTVLYPSRAADATVFDAPPERPRDTAQPLVVGFGGTINTPGYSEALRMLAHALRESGGRLNIYGPISPDNARNAGLQESNISLRGLVPSDEFITHMRDEVDVLFLPISFDEADRENMRLSFPSKLTDYTAAGLAILAFGPAEASGIRWARENPGATEIVDVRDVDALKAALGRLADPAHRARLARQASACGSRDFSHESAQKLFFEHIAGGQR